MSNNGSSCSSEPLHKKRDKGFFVSLKRILSRRRLLSRDADSVAQLRSPPTPYTTKGSGSSELLSAVVADAYEASNGCKAPPRSSASMPLLFPATASSVASLPTCYGGVSPIPSGVLVGRRLAHASSSSSSTAFVQLPAIEPCAPAISSSAMPDRLADASSLPQQLSPLGNVAGEPSRLRPLSSAPARGNRGSVGGGGAVGSDGTSPPHQENQTSPHATGVSDLPERSAASLPLPALPRFTPRGGAGAAKAAAPLPATSKNGTTVAADAGGAARPTARASSAVMPTQSFIAGAAVATGRAAEAPAAPPAAAAGGATASLRTTPNTPIASPKVISPNNTRPASSAAATPMVVDTPLPAAATASAATTTAGPATAPASTLLAMCPAAPEAMRRSVWRLADYTISGRLYKGEVSAVYKASCKLSGSRVVLKVYSLSRVADNALHTLVREVRIHTQLDHENVLCMYGVFEEDDRLILVLERAVRGDLFHLHRSLPNFRMSEDQLRVLVLAPLLDALVYLHARGVCHRDIKPENLLMSGGWQLRVADFGAAIDLTQERAVTRTGTMDYMAPEVERCPLKLLPEDNKNNPDLAYTTAADVWSVGVLAYEMLVGFPPFINCTAGTGEEAGGAGGGGGMGGGAGAAGRRELCFPHFVSAGGQDFISLALAERPMDRPTAAQLLRHPWLKHALRQHHTRQQQQQQAQQAQQQAQLLQAQQQQQHVPQRFVRELSSMSAGPSQLMVSQASSPSSSHLARSNTGVPNPSPIPSPLLLPRGAPQATASFLR